MIMSSSLGDLKADGTTWNDTGIEESLVGVFSHDEYEVLISDDTDTNVVDASGADTRTALDRIIVTDSLVRRVESEAGLCSSTTI